MMLVIVVGVFLLVEVPLSGGSKYHETLYRFTCTVFEVLVEVLYWYLYLYLYWLRSRSESALVWRVEVPRNTSKIHLFVRRGPGVARNTARVHLFEIQN